MRIVDTHPNQIWYRKNVQLKSHRPNVSFLLGYHTFIYSLLGIKDRQSTRNKKEKKKREDKNIFVHSGTECNQSCAFRALLCTNNCINEHYVLVLCTKVVKTGKSARKGRYLRLRFPKLAKMSTWRNDSVTFFLLKCQTTREVHQSGVYIRDQDGYGTMPNSSTMERL